MNPKSAVIALSMVFLLPPPLHARMSHGELMDALTNSIGILRYEHAWDIDDAYHDLLSSGDATQDELSAALVEAAESLSASGNDLDASAARMAAGSLGEFGTVNAIPFLEQRMREDGGSAAAQAAWQLVKLGTRYPEARERLCVILKDETWTDPGNARLKMYLSITQMFYGNDSNPEFINFTDRLRDFLLEASTFETREPERLDDALCLAIPSYAESPERLRFAARIAAAERAAGRTDGRFAAIEANLRVAGVSETGATETDSP